MPYYGNKMGDYYMGDYYMGDPGFFSALGNLAKGIAGHIPVVGSAVSAVTGALAKRTPGTLVRAGEATAGITRRVGGIVAKHPVLSAAGAAGAIGVFGGGAAERMIAPGVAGKGFHMSKARRGHPSHLVRNRHMRVTNPRALRRALRRAHGFAKLAMKTIHLVHPRKKGRFAGFRKRKRA